MTREEAINHLKDILAEATETEDAVCYVTNEDAETLKMAIEALSTDIVRCKDCKYTETDGCGVIYCQIWDRWEMPGEGFCFRGCLPEIMTPPQGEINEEEK